jgi:RimJ/RimL family protein N-acetyltransferase
MVRVSSRLSFRVLSDGVPATEATRWTVNHAFTQLNAHRVSLQVLGDNTRALALYKKVYVPSSSSLCARPELCDSGFVEEGRDREANFQDGKWSDNVRMAILEREWKAL